MVGSRSGMPTLDTPVYNQLPILRLVPERAFSLSIVPSMPAACHLWQKGNHTGVERRSSTKEALLKLKQCLKGRTSHSQTKLQAECLTVECDPNHLFLQFQADSQALLQDPYSNPQLREAVFKKSPPQPAGFYPNYLQPHSPPQATGRPRGNWPLPNAMTHYEYPSPANFMPHNGNTSINSDDGNGVDVGSSPTHMAMVHSATQWSS